MESCSGVLTSTQTGGNGSLTLLHGHRATTLYLLLHHPHSDANSGMFTDASRNLGCLRSLGRASNTFGSVRGEMSTQMSAELRKSVVKKKAGEEE